MRHMFRWFFPSEFFKKPQYFNAFGLGMAYLAILLLQLFTYEKFPDIVFGFGIPGGGVASHVIAIILPLSALLALPYLLSMKLDGLIRIVSQISVITMPLLWLLVALWINLSTTASHENTGLFGATVPTPVGWWVVVIAALMVWAAVLAVHELPPRKNRL